MTREVDTILEEDIPDWNRCFNCAFVYKIRKMSYGCKVRKKMKDIDDTLPVDYHKVKMSYTCEHLFRRPRFGAETYGYPVIIYAPQEGGVKKFEKTEEYKRMREDVVVAMRELKIPRIKPSLGFGWSWTSIRPYALKRNRVIHNPPRGKYKCEHCGKIIKRFFEIHHIRERTEGGSNTLANLTLLCYYCHSLESWKFMSKNDAIPERILWRKGVEFFNMKCDEKWRGGGYKRDIERYDRELKIISDIKGDPVRMETIAERKGITVVEVKNNLDDFVVKYHAKIREIYNKTKKLRKRMRYWKQQEKISRPMLDEMKWRRWQKNSCHAYHRSAC